MGSVKIPLDALRYSGWLFEDSDKWIVLEVLETVSRTKGTRITLEWIVE